MEKTNFSKLTSLLFCLALIIWGNKSFTQCIVYESPASEEMTTPPSSCGVSIDYAPTAVNPEQTPIKTIRMVWHFMLDDNGQGNFNDVDITNAGHNNQSAFLIRFHNQINTTLRSLSSLNRTDPNNPTPHIPDSRIQFDMQQSDVFFHNNTNQMNNPNGWISHYSQYVTNNTSMTHKKDAIHVFFYPDIVGAGSSWATLSNNIVAHNGAFEIFSDSTNINNGRSWEVGGSLLHELFHCVGLKHTNNTGNGNCDSLADDGCDDTPSSQTLNPCPCWNLNSPDGLPCSNNVMDYNINKNGLSRCQLGKLHYNLINNSTINKFLIEDFCQHQSTELITIQSGNNFTWDNTRYLKGDLVIENNASLTIKCFVSLAHNSQIYIKAGGKLIVDGGTLTTICGADWKGIIVEGSTGSPQNDASQGVIELKSGATIENAVNAISLAGRLTNGNIDWNTTGGIVRAENSTFLNNKRDIEFLSYHSYAGNGREFNNTSYFSECNFITDDDGTGSFMPTTHVTMWDVNGVHFWGCIFEDQRTSIIPASDGVKGIYAINSGFTVDRVCLSPSTPCSGPKSKFINLKQAIEANGLSNPQKTIHIIGSEFDSYRGAELLCINQANINNNSFNLAVKALAPKPNFFPVGIYLDQSTGFRIYENTFIGDADANNSQLGVAAGLVIRRSGANNDNFTNNTFNQLITGSQSIGYNRDKLGTKGLIFKCNDYNDNLDDMFITKFSTDPGPHNLAGIHQHQVSSSMGLNSADNFFGNTSPILLYNIDNKGSWINYIHRDPTLLPQTKPLSVTPNVTLAQVSGNRECIVSFDNIDIALQWNTVNTKKPLITAKRNTWENTIDNGNTPGRVLQVQTADGTNVNTIYNDILSDAPWVSDEVLKEIANAGLPFTNTMIRDILVACPQAARSVDIQNILDERIVPLTQQQRDDINNMATTFTNYDNFIEEWADLSREYQDAINNILHEYFADGLDHMADLDNLLKDEDNINNYYLLAEIYYSKGMMANGDAVVALIPSVFELNTEQQTNNTNFLNFHSTINQWKAASKDFTNLDPNDIQWLETFGQSKDKVFGNSISFLKLNEESDYYGEVYSPQSTSTSSVLPTTITNVYKNKTFSIFPNPVSSELNIKTNEEIQKLFVYDITGRIIMERENLKKGAYTLNTSEMAKGIYIVTITINNVTESHKFVKE